MIASAALISPFEFGDLGMKVRRTQHAVLDLLHFGALSLKLAPEAADLFLKAIADVGDTHARKCIRLGGSALGAVAP